MNLLSTEQLELLKADAIAAILAGDAEGLREVIGAVARNTYAPWKAAGLDEALFVEIFRYLAVKDMQAMVDMIEHLLAWGEKEFAP